MNTSIGITCERGAGLLAALFAIGCGGVSNSELAACVGGQPGSSGGSGGSAGTGGPGTGGSGGTTMTGTGGNGGSSAGGTGVTPDAGVVPQPDGAPAGACPAQTTLTLAVHIIMDATWPAGTATTAGSGPIHLWNLSKLKATGGDLAGNETRSCGTVLPEFSLNGAGRLVTGGSKVHVEIPNAVWDAPEIPKLESRGRIAGWDPGNAFNIDGTVALIGMTSTDPIGMWPKTYTGIMAVDADGDGKPGFTAVPRAGSGYVQPPTGLGIFGSAPSADRLYLASRTVVSLEGKLTSCTEVSGTAKISFFDSHVVGCHVKGGADCTPAQTDFVDSSRTVYKVNGATFIAKKIADDATCADARAALPL